MSKNTKPLHLPHLPQPTSANSKAKSKINIIKTTGRFNLGPGQRHNALNLQGHRQIDPGVRLPHLGASHQRHALVQPPSGPKPRPESCLRLPDDVQPRPPASGMQGHAPERAQRTPDKTVPGKVSPSRSPRQKTPRPTSPSEADENYPA